MYTPAKARSRSWSYLVSSYYQHKRYMSFIGSLICLVKHSRPKLSNVVHELYKFMDRANMSPYKALLLVIKYLLDTKYHIYQINPGIDINGQQEIRGYSDADFSGYSDTS